MSTYSAEASLQSKIFKHPLVDSHCHLDFNNFKSDFDQVILHAKKAGVIAMQTISTKLSDFHKLIKITSNIPEVFCSLGIHPLEVNNELAASAEQLIALAATPKVIGIGETGLDYHYDTKSKDLQIRSFVEHIKASQKTGLPIIVHTRSAEDDTLEIFTDQLKKAPFKAVLHCFTGTEKFAIDCLKLDFYISFAGIVTFKNALDLKHIAQKVVPMDKMLIETDAPYLAPLPHRGKRNEPAFIEHTAKFIADLRNIPYAELANVTSENFFRLFNKAKI